MKSLKHISLIPLLGAIAVMLLSACSKHHDDPDLPDEQLRSISFRGKEMATEVANRAGGVQNLEDVLPDGKKNFYVWSYKTKSETDGNYTDLQTIMDQYLVRWTVGTAGSTVTNGYDWEYVGITDHGQKQNIKYWDMKATSYRFFAIAPGDMTGITSHGQNGNVYDFTFNADASDPTTMPYISKLWISNNGAEFPRHYGETVVMEFMKPITKVRIQLINEQGELIEDPIDAGVTSLQFAPMDQSPIVQKGTLRVSYPLQGPITFTQYLPMLTIIGDPTGSIEMTLDGRPDNDYADWYYVLPHIIQQAYQMKLIVYDKTRLATVPAELMSWNPNMEYTYRFKLTASEVQFIDIVQVGVTTWKREDSTHPIYNW